MILMWVVMVNSDIRSVFVKKKKVCKILLYDGIKMGMH